MPVVKYVHNESGLPVYQVYLSCTTIITPYYHHNSFGSYRLWIISHTNKATVMYQPVAPLLYIKDFNAGSKVRGQLGPTRARYMPTTFRFNSLFYHTQRASTPSSLGSWQRQDHIKNRCKIVISIHFLQNHVVCVYTCSSVFQLTPPEGFLVHWVIGSGWIGGEERIWVSELADCCVCVRGEGERGLATLHPRGRG